MSAKKWVGFFLLLPTIAAAQPTPLLEKTNNQAIVALTGLYVNYREVDGSQFLDGETGTIPGFSLQLMKTFSSIYTEINSTINKGNLRYEGYYGDFNTGTIDGLGTCDADTLIIKVNAKLGYMTTINNALQFIPYVQIGFRQWDRMSEAHMLADTFIAGSAEAYSNYIGALGGQLNWQATQNIVIVPHIALGETLAPVMKEYHSNLYDFQLGQTAYYEAGVAAYYFLNDHINLNASLGFDHFGFGHSNRQYSPEFDSFIYEPDSRTNELTASIGVGFSFA